MVPEGNQQSLPPGVPMTAATLDPGHRNERAPGRGVHVGVLRPGTPGDLAHAPMLQTEACGPRFESSIRNNERARESGR